ncbi:MAG TPA: hypothetical protein VD978_18720 [Azospirillum sp.]|nr:hypothetical protein [Azospirillum sp.]
MRPIVAVLVLLATLSEAAPALAERKADPAMPAAVRIRSLLVPVVNHGQVEKYTQYEVTMELADASKLPDAQAQTARLQDAVLRVIYAGIEQGWIVRGTIANATALRQRLDEAGQKLIGKQSIARVLIVPVGRQSSLQ